MVAAKASLVSLVPGVDKSPVVVGVGVTRTQSLAPGVEIYTSILHQKKQRVAQRPAPRDSSVSETSAASRGRRRTEHGAVPRDQKDLLV